MVQHQAIAPQGPSMGRIAALGTLNTDGNGFIAAMAYRCTVSWGIESPLAHSCFYKSSMMYPAIKEHKEMKS